MLSLTMRAILQKGSFVIIKGNLGAAKKRKVLKKGTKKNGK